MYRIFLCGLLIAGFIPFVVSAQVTRTELATHNTQGNCWVAYQGQVYDITDWLPRHPGSAAAIAPYCGTADEFERAFSSQHGTRNVGRLMQEGVYKGTLTQQATAAAPVITSPPPSFAGNVVAQPTTTGAASALRAQIQALLAQIAQLQTNVQQQAPANTYTPTYTQTTPAPTYTASANTGDATFRYSRCPNLQYNLERGDRDAAVAVEVTMLQRFLAQDTALYPEAQITGFFGPATERAVQRFQERHGIVSYGDYQATGYGRVGPRTRHAIKNSCGADGGQALSITPTTGAAPLRVTVSFEGTGSTCTSYLIDWGDGTAPASYNAPNPQSCPSDRFARTATHTYTKTGTFNVALRMGNTTAALAPVVGTATVTVSGGSYGYTNTYQYPYNNGQSGQPYDPPTTNIQTSSCFVSPQTGTAPLGARAHIVLGGTLCDGTFIYQVDWGDGTLTPQRTCTNEQSHYDTFTHTYSTPGTYTARLLQSHPQARFEEDACTVTVTNGTTGVGATVGQVAPPQCARWYDGCNTCTRGYAGGPAQCTLRTCAQYGQLQCYQYFTTANTTPVQNDALTVQSTTPGTSAYAVTFAALINGARNCDGGLYTVDFGDGNYSQQPYPADACRAFDRPVTHTYTSNGVYTARLLKDGVTKAQVQITVSSIAQYGAVTQLANVWQALVQAVGAIIRN